MEIAEFITPYYIMNLLLVLIYPLMRLRGMNSYGLQMPDTMLGHTRETSIIITFVLFAAIRYKKYCTAHHAVSSILFYLKVANCCLFFFVDFRLCIVYFLLSSRNKT